MHLRSASARQTDSIHILCVCVLPPTCQGVLFLNPETIWVLVKLTSLGTQNRHSGSLVCLTASIFESFDVCGRLDIYDGQQSDRG